MCNVAIRLRMLRVKYGEAGGGSNLHRQIRAVDRHGNTIVIIFIIISIVCHHHHKKSLEYVRERKESVQTSCKHHQLKAAWAKL